MSDQEQHPAPEDFDDTALLAEAAAKLTLLERRRIEAGVLVPLIRAFQQEFGEERASAVTRRVIVEIAEQQGRERAAALGRDDLTAFSWGMQAMGSGALEIELVERNEERVGFNVRRCRFAEMYQAMGAGDLGFVLSCNRDFSNVAGFNPAIALKRSQTIMQGAAYCDFRYAAPVDGPETEGTEI
jgi:hypothetical protein